MRFRGIWAIVKETVKGFGEASVLRLSAALAYYAMFSIGPLLVIAVGLAGIALGSDSIRQSIHAQLQSTLGESSTRTVESMMATQKPGTSLITTIAGIGALLCGAGGVFGALQDALNTIWGVKARPGKGIWRLVRARFLSLAMVLGTGFLLLVSMILTTILAAATDSLGSHLPIPVAVVRIVNVAFSLGVITVLFAMIFKYLPDIEIPFRFAWAGAAATAALFTAGKYVLAWYLGRHITTSLYGAAGAVIVILLWVYYASVILFLGAEFTRACTKVLGVKILPSSYAEPISQDARAAQGLPANVGSPTQREPAAGSKRTPVTAIPVTASPLGFLGIMVAAGFAAGLLMTLKSARKTAQMFTSRGRGGA